MVDFVDKLSSREHMVAERYASGDTYKQIAEALSIAPTTVRSHVTSIYSKLGVKNKPALISVLSRNQTNTVNPVTAPPDRPSIAVLPFVNLCEDADSEYFVEGITQEILTSLSRFREIIVTARGSSDLVSNQKMDACEAASALGVVYVLCGSVRRAKDRVRISASLVAGESGHQVWSEQYDHVLDDIFKVQDEVSQRVVTMLVGKIEHSDRERSAHKRTNALSAYECVLRGRHFFKDWHGSEEDVKNARKMFEQAIQIDPKYAAAYSGLAATYIEEYDHGWSNNLEATGLKAFELARKAIALDEYDSNAHLVLLFAYWHVKSDFEIARSHLETAIELNPNHYLTYCYGCMFSVCAGDLETSAALARESLRRNPLLPDSCLWSLGFTEYLTGCYEKAIATICQMDTLKSENYACLAACYAQLGRLDDARRAAGEFAGLNDRCPMRIAEWRDYWGIYLHFKEQLSVDRLIEGLDKAGLVRG
jgi:TolB-like protein/Flp pilus assembly protein TadD